MKKNLNFLEAKEGVEECLNFTWNDFKENGIFKLK